MFNKFSFWIVSGGVWMLPLLCAGNPALAKSNDLHRASTLAGIAFEYARVERPDRAIALLEQAETLSHGAATETCYGATPLLKIGVGYLTADQSELGQQYLTQAFEVARDRTAENCHVSATSPQESLLNRASEYAEAGHLDLAWQIAEGVDDGMHSITLASLAAHYAAAGQQRQAENVLSQAITQAVEFAQQYPEDLDVTQMLLFVASTLVEAEQPELANGVIETALLQAPGGFSGLEAAALENFETYQTLNLVQLLADLNQPEQALALLDAAVTNIQPVAGFPQQGTYDRVEAALLYSALGRREQAADVLAKAQQLSDASTQAILVQGYAGLGEFDQALTLAASIESTSERQRAHGTIAAEYAKAGSAEAASSLAQSIGNPEFVRLEIMRAYLETDQYDQARQIALEADMRDFLPEVGQAYLAAGEPEQALQLIDSVPSADSADWLRQSTAVEFAAQAQFESALELAEAIAAPEAQAATLTAIAAHYTSSDTAARANASWGRFWSRLTHPLQAWFGVSDREKAVELLDQAVEVL